MKKALLIAPILILVFTVCGLATRWYEVEDSKPVKPQVKTESTVETSVKVEDEKTEEPAGDRVFKLVETWMYTYGGRGEDTCRSITRTADGYVMAGYTRSFGAGGGDAWFIKTSLDGKALWDKTYGVTLEEDALDIVASDTGGYCVAGKDSSNKLLALKLGDDGEVIWKKQFGGSLPATGVGADFSPGGGCMAVGYFSWNPGKSCDGYAWISELDSAGESVWEWNDAPSCTSLMRAVKATQFGTYIAAGEKYDGSKTTQYWIVKLDANRTIRWEIIDATKNYKVYSVKSLIATDDGGFVVFGGAKVSADRGDFDGWMIKVDAAGTVKWESHYNAPGDPDIINDVIQIEGGGFAAVGYKLMASGKFKGSILETDEYGAIKWHKTYGGAGAENFTGIVPAVEGDGFVVAGVTTSKGAGNFDFVILKTDRRGVCRGCNF